MFHRVSGLQDSFTLQSNLDRLATWAEKWQMQIIYGKCKVINYGRENKELCHDMDGAWIRKVEEEGALGVVVNKYLKILNKREQN